MLRVRKIRPMFESAPIQALRDLQEVRRALDVLERRIVRTARRDRESWGDIARALGVSSSTAHRRFHELNPPGDLLDEDFENEPAAPFPPFEPGSDPVPDPGADPGDAGGASG